MKKILLSLLSVLFVLSLLGCGSKKEAVTLSQETKDAVENLNSIQASYSTGVAPLIEIPVVWAEDLYNNYDNVISSGIEGAPIQLREYAETNVVYFDYSDDFSVVWNKNEGNVMIEATDTAERDAFMEKMHK